MLIDVHAHMDYPAFDADRQKVLEDAQQAGLSFIISNGTDLKQNKEILALAKKFPIIRPAFGLYPTHAAEFSNDEIDETFRFIEEHIKDCIAFGEIGLDYYELKNPEAHAKQKEVLLRFFELAKKYDKPVILHSRKAEADVVSMVENSGLKKVFFGEKN